MKPSAWSAMEMDVRMLRSSSTSAITWLINGLLAAVLPEGGGLASEFPRNKRQAAALTAQLLRGYRRFSAYVRGGRPAGLAAVFIIEQGNVSGRPGSEDWA